MTDPNHEGLEPCAHCGATNPTPFHGWTGGYQVGCRYCDMRTGEFRTEEEAVSAWNARVPSPAPDALRNALVSAKEIVPRGEQMSQSDIVERLREHAEALWPLAASVSNLHKPESDNVFGRARTVMCEAAALIVRQNELIVSLREECERHADRIGNAMQAASETHHSWKDRCYAILAGLECDYGDPDFMMPDEINKLEAAVAKAKADALTDAELHLCRQWFDSVQDTNEHYLDMPDYVLAKRLYERLKILVPNSINDRIPQPRGKE